MPSTITADTPLSTLYLQIEYGETPAGVLGVGKHATLAEIRDTYRIFAMKIHPDKAPNDKLRTLHTLLFQKVQSAYDTLLGGLEDLPTDMKPAAPKQLPETLASLHTRNVASTEALHTEREAAVKRKQTATAERVATLAKLEAKNIRLAGERALRTQTEEKQRVNKIASRDADRLKSVAKKSRDGASATKPATDQGSSKTSPDISARPVAKKLVLRSKSTAQTATPMWSAGLDQRLVPAADIANRQDKAWLTGGLTGSVSLSEQKRKENSAAAQAHKMLMARCEEDDVAMKAALKGHNSTFSGLDQERLMTDAFVEAEAKIEARTDRALELMDGDVVDEHYLEGASDLNKDFEMLAIKWS